MHLQSYSTLLHLPSPSQIVTTLQKTLLPISPKNHLDQIGSFISDNIYDEDINVLDYIDYITDVKERFKYLFAYIKRNASIAFNKSNKNNNSITDGDRLSFNFNKDIINIINGLKIRLNFIMSNIVKTEVLDVKVKLKKEQLINWLSSVIYLLEDMSLGNDRSNIYWVSFYDEDYINLGYVIKDKSIVTKKIFDRNAR